MNDGWTNKVLLQHDETHPLCPWCETPLHMICWHKVRGGPPSDYTAVLSCPQCLGVLDCLNSTMSQG